MMVFHPRRARPRKSETLEDTPTKLAATPVTMFTMRRVTLRANGAALGLRA